MYVALAHKKLCLNAREQILRESFGISSLLLPALCSLLQIEDDRNNTVEQGVKNESA